MKVQQVQSLDQKLQKIMTQLASDKVISQTILKNYQYNIKSQLQSKTNNSQQNIGQFQILIPIPHLDSINKNRIEYYDYVCIKEKSQVKHVKRTQLTDQYWQQQTMKKKIYILCQCNAVNQDKMLLDFYELKKLFEEIITSEYESKNLSNLLFPSSDSQILANSEHKRFIPFNISALTPIINNVDTFYPLKNMTFSQKFQSQLYCLNLFYRFLLTIAKPLYNIIKNVHENYQHLKQTIEKFILDCLFIENVFYEQKSNQFYLFFNNKRFRSQKNKIILEKNQPSSVKQQARGELQIQNRFLQKVSQIFWVLFFPLQNSKDHSKISQQLHNSFMSNFLAAIRQGQVTFQQTLQILQSKNKRKAFINSKIHISQSKQLNNFHSINGKRKLSVQQRYSETIDVTQPIKLMNNFQGADGGSSNIQGHKQKSVKRKLKQKRNTIDVMFQNYLTQKDVPPSFLNRSLEKKGRLFKHQKSVNKSKSKDRSIQSFYETIQKETLENHSLNYSSSKKKSISSYDPQIKNSRYNLVQKLMSRQVSKTIQIAEINHLKARFKQNSDLKNNQTLGFQNQKQVQDSILQKKQSLKFVVKSNLKSSKQYLKSSTQKLTKKGQTISTQLNQNNTTFLNTKQNAFIKTNGLSTQTNKFINPSKKANRRYYYHPNNFTSNMMDNQSIKRLIEDQMELYRTVQTQKSRQKQLLNKSQQKALANFNREFKRNIHHHEQEKSLQISKYKEFNVKISKNPSSLIKKDKNNVQAKGQTNQNSDRPISELKSALGSKRAGYHSKQFVDTFSPPKSKKKSYTQAIQVQFSPNFIEDKNLRSIDQKIDNSSFKAKLSSYFTTDVNAFYRNSIGSPHKIQSQLLQNKIQRQAVEDKTSIPNSNKISILQQIQASKKFKSQTFNFKDESPQMSKQKNDLEINLNQIKKVQNEYFIQTYTQIQDQNIRDQSLEKQGKKVTMDRTQKGLMNAAKKLNKKINNQNFNVEEIFVEQQALLKAQQQVRRSIQKNDQKIQTQIQIKKQEMEGQANQNLMKNQISQSKNDKKFQEIESMISPIKHVNIPNSQKSIIELKKEYDQGQEKQILHNNQKKQQDENIFKAKQFVSKNIQSQATKEIQEKLQNINSESIQNTTKSVDEQKVKQKVKKNTFIDMSKDQINEQQIEEGKIIQKIPILSTNKKQTIQTQQKKDNSLNQNKQKMEPKQMSTQDSSKKLVSNQKEPKPTGAQHIKQVKKQPKNTTKIKEQEDFELEQIKLAPVQQPKPIPSKKVNPTNQKQVVVNQSQKSQKQLNMKKVPSNKTNEQQKSQKKQISSSNQPPLPSKTNQQTYQPQKIQSSDKKVKQSHRQNTSKSSQASSYGPHKSVKKIVQEYVYFVNRIGQAVAKSALVSKKVQKVCEWYVGVYFLYKRFFYERRKIQKFLKQGTPKLTRYDEEMNKDEWLLYLKSNDRQQLLKKVSDQNIKITQSLQKMQGKLMARNVPDEIKRFSAISQRSNQQSLIAIDAVIDEFDALTDKGMLIDEDILGHCTSLLNACLVLAQLDQLVEDIVPVSELVKQKRTPEQLEVIAQDLFDLYHAEDEDQQKR